MQKWTLTGFRMKTYQGVEKELLVFDVDGREQTLYREGLALKLTLGGYEDNGWRLAALFITPGMSFKYDTRNYQCYVNPNLP